MTSPRRRSSKSMSKSGIETRSGLRKRSKIRPCSSGSRSVMRMAYAAIEPAPEPRPGADPDTVVLGPVDEVGDDEEVARETHLGDDAGLELGLLADLVGDALGVAVGEPLLDLLDEPGVLRLPLGHSEPGHVVGRGVELDVAALGDEQGVVTGLGQAVALGPQLAHLLGRLDVVAVSVELEAVGVRHGAARRHAQQVLVGTGVLGAHVVGVVGGDRRDRQVLAQPQQPVADAGLDVEAVVHQLEEVVLRTEDVAEVGRGLAGLVVVADAQPRLDLARGAAGGADEAAGVLGEQLAVGARLVEVALQRGARGEPEEVVHARPWSRPAASCGCRRPSRRRRRRRRGSTAPACARSGRCSG